MKERENEYPMNVTGSAEHVTRHRRLHALRGGRTRQVDKMAPERPLSTVGGAAITARPQVWPLGLHPRELAPSADNLGEHRSSAFFTVVPA